MNAVIEQIRSDLGRVKAKVDKAPLRPDFGKMFQYSDAQRWVFFDSASRGRYRFFPKGRRAGMTRGAAHAAIEWVNGGLSVLWGDTTQGNLVAYFELYFKPALEAKGLDYHWSAQRHMLRIGKGIMQMRSAERPDTWEGFGYHRIILNEAGIILENGALFDNTVRPMMLDFQDSELVAIGKPKGRNKFKELFDLAIAGEPGYYTPATHIEPQSGQTHFAYTALDNPWLNLEASAKEISSMPDGVREQEGLGQFVDDQKAFRVIPRAWVQLAMERSRGLSEPTTAPDALGVDVARGGKDATVISPRWGVRFGVLESYPGSQTPDGPLVAALALTNVNRPWQVGESTQINVDITGVGSSPYDHIKSTHKSTNPFNNAAGTDVKDKSGQFRFRNLRAAAYWAIRELLDPSNGLEPILPYDLELADDLCEPTYKITSVGIQIEAKEDIAKRLGRSPGKGDGLVMSNWVFEQPNSQNIFV